MNKANTELYKHLIPTIDDFFRLCGVSRLRYQGPGIGNADFLDSTRQIVGEIKHSGELGHPHDIAKFWEHWRRKQNSLIHGLVVSAYLDDVVKGFVALIYGQLQNHVISKGYSKGWLVLEYPSRWSSEFAEACDYLKKSKLAVRSTAIVVRAQLEIGFYEFLFPSAPSSSQMRRKECGA